ncbi:hypothetical protein [Blastopirellula marina]|uniref:hypothetical protein n=1 Tax=Blastopirellula marina TaxID=124 RepID=UPI0011AFEDA0|nr:hypothetical protein [Blastopirellula marina]
MLPSAWAEEIDANEAVKRMVKRMFETRDQLVSGRCSIAGFSEFSRGRSFGDTEERMELVFDDRVPAFLIEDGMDSAFLANSEFQYHATHMRTHVERFPAGFNLSGRGSVLPFDIHLLGFVENPSKRIDRGELSYTQYKEWFAHAELLEIAKAREQLRIKVRLPRSASEAADIDRTYQLWLDPTRDYVTTRIEQLYSDRDGVIFRDEMLWEKVNNVWVITHFRQLNGRGAGGPSAKPALQWKLIWSDVNKKIPDSEFELESLPNPGREARIAGRFAQKIGDRDYGSLGVIQSREPKPEGDPDWSSLPPVE